MPGRKKAPGSQAGPESAVGGQPRTDAAGPDPSAAAAQSGRATPDAAAILPVVGMVASAGGLGAFKAFFDAMPADNGMAFVLIPHLDPRHESLMAELLARHTDMPVDEARQGQRLAANHVYVIPPNRSLTLHDGKIQLGTLPAQGTGETAIDPFLQSLADDQHERAVCIILSGTGTHGTSGLKAVKAAGGMVMVQDPRSAEYDRMPRSGVDTGLADYVLPPEKMPRELVRYVRHFVAGIAAQPQPADAGDDLAKILALLQARTKYDFRSYRKAMLMRRIQRRMGLNHLERLADYLPVLRQRQEEVDKLSRDLLINVTEFFRDAEMYQALESQVLPELIGRHDPDTPLRVWVPGCATGEEAYSIAILLTERVGAMGSACPVQVFATDVDRASLDVGRQGIYAEATLTPLGHQRLERFFTRVDAQHWQVNKQLREEVLFAHQNVLADAPFSRMDLVSCRNLLIYLEPEVQHKLLQLFHFALNPEGYLVLGPSESIGRHVDLFRPISKKWRIFAKSGGRRPAQASFPIQPGTRVDEARPPLRQAPAIPGGIGELARKVLLESYAPAAVVTNNRQEILQYSGPTYLYLQQPGGPPSHDLLSLVHPSLRAHVRKAVQQAATETRRCDIGGIPLRRGEQAVSVRISAQPLEGKGVAADLLLIAFQDEAVRSQAQAVAEQGGGNESLMRQLEMELKSTREELQSTIEELESSNEELKASNEEVMSMNEELQSTNEELETSKEELQSLNEELATVNAQLRDKVDELEGASNDMSNLLASADIATLFLGPDGKIRRFTPATTRLFNLIAGDLGRPISDITPRFEDPALAGDIEDVLQQLAPREQEVRGEGERWYLRRVTPYRTADNHIDGVVLTFSDITLVKQADAALAQERDLLQSIMNGAGKAHLVYLDPDFNFVRVNETYAATCGFRPEEMIGKNHFVLYPDPENEAIFRRVLDTGEAFEVHDKRFEFPGEPERRVTYWDWTLIPVKGVGGKVTGLILSLFETTARVQAEAELNALRQSLEEKVGERTADLKAEIAQRRQAEAALRVSEARLRTIFEQAPIGITQADPAEGRLLVVNPAYCAIVGYGEDELIGRRIADITHPDDREADREGMRRLVAREIDIYTREKRYLHSDGGIVWVAVNASLVRDTEGRPLHTVAMITNITELRRAEEAAREHLEEASRLQRLQTANELATLLAHELNQPLATIATYAEVGEQLLRVPSPDPDKVAANLKRISEQALRAGDIIRHLRSLVSRRQVDPTPMDLNEVVRNACDLMSPQARRSAVRLEMRLDPELSPLMGVDVQVEQVLLNLLRNACDAIQDAGMDSGTVTVETRRSGDMARVTVSDSGPGIEADMASALFEPLASRKTNGLGVGLRISRSLMEAHGGRLWVEPRVPGGVFHFELPLKP